MIMPESDVESVQVNVVLFWLQDLASEQRRQGKPRDAAESLRKAVLYMASDKGEPLALVRCDVDMMKGLLIIDGFILTSLSLMSTE